MTSYGKMNTTQLRAKLEELQQEYEICVARGMKLDLSRGKPEGTQLDLAMDLLDTVNSQSGAISESGIDCRNYGVLEGLPEVRQMMAEMLGVTSDEIIVGGSSSLNLMYDTISRAMTVGLYGSGKPWGKETVIKFLCPVPGYDRHFSICQHFGIEMISIDMNAQGPNMDQVEAAIKDPAVRGIWCVPKYSNPQGITYSKNTVERFSQLQPVAPDFRIFWDNAYVIHGFEEDDDHLENLFDLLKKNGKEDMIFIFGSTSKISFAGGGLAAIAGSQANMALTKKQLSIQTITYDKINQLMHARYFKNYQGMLAHMKRHAALVRPKFHRVGEILAQELDGLEIAWWTMPKGGYFISLRTLENCAKRIVQLCAQAGLILTPAGATYPYGIAPMDNDIRIAPTFARMEEVQEATSLLTLCTKIASIERLLTIRI